MNNKANSSFKSKAVSAMAWSAGLQTASQVLNFILGIYLARLLTPTDFGLVAMVLVFVAFSELLTNFGLSSAIIQKQNITQSHYYSAYWFSAALGAILSALMFFASGAIAEFYDSMLVKEISQALSCIFLASSICAIPTAKLQKELLHKKTGTISLVSSLIGGLAGVACALADFSYWSIVVQWLTVNWLKALLLHIAAGFRIKLTFSTVALKELLSFSVIVFSTQTLRKITVQFDKLIVGKFIDAATLGLYNRAHELMSVPTKNVARVVSGVMFPALSSIQNDKQRVANIYLKTIGVIALISFPLLIGVAVVAPYFIEVVLGSKWLNMTPYLRFFCYLGLLQSLVTVTGIIYLSQGKPKLQLKINLFNQPLQLASVFFGIQYGMEMMLISYFLAYLISSLVTWYFVTDLLGITILDILSAVSGVLVTSIFMLLVILSIDTWLLNDELSALMKLLALSSAGGLAYLSSSIIVKPEPFIALVGLIQERAKQRFS